MLGIIYNLISINPYLVIFVAILSFLIWSDVSYFRFDVLKDILRRRNMYRKLPGPKGLPFIGSALEVNKCKPYETFHDWSKKFGSVYLVNMFGKKILVLSSTEAIYEALITRGQDFSGRPALYYRSKFMSDGSQDIVSASPGPVWSILRKTVQREMKKYDPGYQRLEQLTNSIIDDILQDFKQHNGNAFDLREFLFSAIVNVTFLFLVGDKLDKDDPKLLKTKKLIEVVTKVMNVGGDGAELDYFPWLRFFGNKTYNDIVEAKRLRDEIFDWISQKVNLDLEQGADNDGVIHGFELLLREGKENLTSTNVKLAMVNLLIGSVSSTYNYLYLFCNLMIHYPQVQKNLQEEIDRTIDKNQRPSLRDQERMHYVRATLIELLRFGSLSPILIPHCTTVDTRVCGHDIPAHTTVFMNSRVVHHDPHIWDEPFEFRPERFINKDDGTLVGSDHVARKSLLSFGGGPRACPGKVLALSRLFLVTTNILQNFNIQSDDSKPLTSCDPRNYELGLVLRPPSYKARLMPRL